MSIEDLKFGEPVKLLNVLNDFKKEASSTNAKSPHPMLNRRCLIRTYSAGVHIGDIVYIDGMELQLKNALRLWSWKDGGLSLSAIANEGVVSARIDVTGEVYLTNIIEIIPTTNKAEESYVKFIEN